MAEKELSTGRKIFYVTFGIYLLVNGLWNFISFIGANFPIFLCTNVGKWIILREKIYIFLPSNLIFGIATLFIFYSAFMLIFREPKVKKIALISLGVASITALINSVAVLILLDIFTPSWIRFALNLIGFVLALLI